MTYGRRDTGTAEDGRERVRRNRVQFESRGIREGSGASKAAKGVVELKRVSDESCGCRGLKILKIINNGSKQLLVLSNGEVRHGGPESEDYHFAECSPFRTRVSNFL